MGEELKSLSLLNLRDLAKAKGLKNISKLNKDELINAILEISGMSSEQIEVDSKVQEKEEVNIKNEVDDIKPNNKEDLVVEGVLEVLPDGFGFLRGVNYLSTP